jgi:hypothetical protein
MTRFLLFILVCLYAGTSVSAQSIVVNKIYNATSTGDGMSDAIELLVVDDSLDIRGFIVKDFETNLTTDTGGKYQFNDNPLWQDLRSGTTIVLHRISSTEAGHAEDIDPTDFTLDLIFENTAYLTNIAVGGHRFNITNTDMVVIKTGAREGVANAIHTFATNNGGSSAFFSAVTGPKLVSGAITGTGFFQYPLNPALGVSDYNGTAAATSSHGDRNWGFGFGANNIAYISGLRSVPGTVAPGNLLATPVSGKEISLSWEDNTSDEQLFEIERADDGTNFIRIATVDANTVSFTDRELLGATQYDYRVRSKQTPDYSDYSNRSSATTNPFVEAPQLSSEAIHPNFFGINYWYHESDLSVFSDDLQQAEMKIMRIGGSNFNHNWFSATDYDEAIQYIKAIGAEPLLQIPISLTETELSDWIDYFNNERGYEIKYWAIGNEPDPANRGNNEPHNWSDGTFSYEGYTYPEWEAQFLRLAERIKTHQPRAIIVGGDFRLFYDEVIDDFYAKFIGRTGAMNHNGVPLLDYFSFHYYGFKTEDPLTQRFGKVKTLLDNANLLRTANGFNELRIAVTEVNTTTGTQPYPWEFRAGQFVALMQKKAMEQGALAVTPWSIYESGGRKTVGGTDFSLYGNDNNRRSTMWHVAMLSNNRKGYVMNGEMTLNPDVAFIGMRDETGYTVMIMNMSVSNGYSYRASLDNNYHGAEQIRIKLEGYPGVAGELSDSIAAETTHLYRIDPNGRLISRLIYSAENLANNAGPVEELYDEWTGKYFHITNKFSAFYLWPRKKDPTGNIAQKQNPDLNSEYIQWFFEPALVPGFYNILNRSTGAAIRPDGGVRGFLIEQLLLDSISRADESFMWAIRSTDSEGYYRLENKASGKYLNPKNDKLKNGQSIVQSVLIETDSSFMWRLHEMGPLLPEEFNQSLSLREFSSDTGPSPDKSVRIYPNPITSILTIENEAGYSQIILTDFTGQVLLRQSMDHSAAIDISKLSRGIYTLTVFNENGRTVKRIVKQ